MALNVLVHPATGAVIERRGARHFEDCRITKRFQALAMGLLAKCARARAGTSRFVAKGVR
jgi:hypothetical protein